MAPFLLGDRVLVVELRVDQVCLVGASWYVISSLPRYCSILLSSGGLELALLGVPPVKLGARSARSAPWFVLLCM